ncbi:MAG: acyltransferase [Demequinaceae bacterium]|nr:acyltransferase [Demequinaceae bacterium]
MADAQTAGSRLSLQDGLRGSDNALGVIRLTLAALVIFSHAFYLGGWGEDPTHRWTHGQETIGGLAVVGFFVVSGYLITKSGTRIDFVQFMWHRILRIFPAFLTVLVVTAGIVGPAIWLAMGRPFRDYWTRGAEGPLSYVLSNAGLEIRQWGIHDIFVSTTPYGGPFNGSLWTLAYEWRAYLIIAALVLVGALKHLPSVVAGAAGVTYVAAVGFHFGVGSFGELWPSLGSKETITLTLAFLIGGTMAVWSKRIVLDGRVAAAAGVLSAVTLLTNGWLLLGYPAFAYVLFYIAARLPGWWRRIGSVNDYSYGMYVYGFLVQQVTAYFGWYRWGYLPWVLVTIGITSLCAYASWHAVEKHALRLKLKGPGLGYSYWLARTRAMRLWSAPSSV